MIFGFRFLNFDYVRCFGVRREAKRHAALPMPSAVLSDGCHRIPESATGFGGIKL